MTSLSVARDQRGYTLAELLITVAILGLVMAAVLAVQMTSSTMFLRGENQADAQQGARAAMLMEEDLRMAGYGCPDTGCPTPVASCSSWSQAAPCAAQQKITAASGTSITFWADTLNASTTLCAAAANGATTLSVVDASGIAVNDRIYLNNGATGEWKTVTGKVLTIHTATPCAPADTLSIGALNNPNNPGGYPQGVQVGRPRQVTYQFGGGALSKDAGDGTGLQTLATGVQSLSFSYFNTLDGPGGPPPPGLINENPVTAGSLPTIRRIQIQTVTQSTASAAGPGTYTINTNVRPRNL